MSVPASDVHLITDKGSCHSQIAVRPKNVPAYGFFLPANRWERLAQGCILRGMPCYFEIAACVALKKQTTKGQRLTKRILRRSSFF